MLTKRGVYVLAGGMLSAAPGATRAMADVSRQTTGNTGWWLPENVFPAAEQIDLLFNVILWMTISVCVVVFAVMGAFLIRYRHRPGRHSTFVHGNTRLEAVWTLVPTVILALTAAFSQATWSSIKRAPVVEDGESVVEMEVIAKQFAWYFHYPGADGRLGLRRPDRVDLNAGDPEVIIGLDRADQASQDDLVTTVMTVPVDTKILIKLSSVDVLHSFYLPNFRVKQDSVPGLNTSVWIESTKTSGEVVGRVSSESVLGDLPSRVGLVAQLKPLTDESAHTALEQIITQDAPLDRFSPDVIAKLPLAELPFEVLAGYAKPFDIVCAELCGQGHFTMRGKLYVVTRQQYEAILAQEASYLDFGDGSQEEDY